MSQTELTKKHLMLKNIHPSINPCIIWPSAASAGHWQLKPLMSVYIEWSGINIHKQTRKVSLCFVSDCTLLQPCFTYKPDWAVADVQKHPSTHRLTISNICRPSLVKGINLWLQCDRSSISITTLTLILLSLRLHIHQAFFLPPRCLKRKKKHSSSDHQLLLQAIHV